MNFFITYFFAYLLSMLGYFLGKATDEEHNEIRRFVNIFKEIIVIITYLALFYLFNSSTILFLLCGNLVLKILSFKFKKHYLVEIHNILLLAISIVTLNQFNKEYLFLAILPILVLFLDKSFDKFEFKFESYQIIFYSIIYFLFRF